MTTNVTDELESYLPRLFPLRRSITGEANRETLAILSEIAPIDIHEIPSGREVLTGLCRKSGAFEKHGLKIPRADES